LFGQRLLQAADKSGGWRFDRFFQDFGERAGRLTPEKNLDFN